MSSLTSSAAVKSRIAHAIKLRLDLGFVAATVTEMARTVDASRSSRDTGASGSKEAVSPRMCEKSEQGASLIAESPCCRTPTEHHQEMSSHGDDELRPDSNLTN